MIRRSSYVLALFVAVLAIAGCGVPTQQAATAMTVDNLGHPSSDAAVGPAVGTTTLWFVEDGRLVPVRVKSDTPTAGDIVALLAAGPPQGSSNSTRSLVGDPAHGGTLVAIPPDEASERPTGQVTVAVTDAFGSLPADEQVLLLGQVVTTLGSAGASSVLVTDPAGTALAIPLPDGRLLDGPATASDYASLIR